jgi:hypothetical protein
MAYQCRKDGRHVDQKYLGISPQVLAVPGIRISFGIANSANAEIHSLSDALDLIDVDILYKDWTWSAETQKRLSKVERIELLVPQNIPLKMIERVFDPR